MAINRALAGLVLVLLAALVLLALAKLQPVELQDDAPQVSFRATVGNRTEISCPSMGYARVRCCDSVT